MRCALLTCICNGMIDTGRREGTTTVQVLHVVGGAEAVENIELREHSTV